MFLTNVLIKQPGHLNKKSTPGLLMTTTLVLSLTVNPMMFLHCNMLLCQVDLFWPLALSH